MVTYTWQARQTQKGGLRMRGKLFFEIPDDQEVRVKLVEVIPSNWSWVDGGLYAPKNLVASGQVEENTGFAMERFHSIHPTIIGSYDPTIIGSYDQDEGKRGKPNLFAIMVEQKLPGFIEFDEAGYNSHIVTFELAKRVVVGFLRKGYRGSLCFFRGCYDNNKYDNPARCELIFEPWHGAPVCREEAGEQPARVKLEWESRYYGKEEDIAPIVAECRSLNLREYEPTPAEAVL